MFSAYFQLSKIQFPLSSEFLLDTFNNELWAAHKYVPQMEMFPEKHKYWRETAGRCQWCWPVALSMVLKSSVSLNLTKNEICDLDLC